MKPDADGVLAVAVPVANQRLVTRVAVPERCVGDAGGVRVAQEVHAVAEHADGVDAVAVPVTHDWSIGRRAVGELHIRCPAGVDVAQQEDAAAEHADGVLAVAVPVAADRDVAGATERCAPHLRARSVLVDDRPRPVHEPRGSVDAVTIPVAREHLRARRSELERRVGHTGGEAVAQKYALQRRGARGRRRGRRRRGDARTTAALRVMQPRGGHIAAEPLHLPRRHGQLAPAVGRVVLRHERDLAVAVGVDLGVGDHCGVTERVVGTVEGHDVAGLRRKAGRAVGDRDEATTVGRLVVGDHLVAVGAVRRHAVDEVHEAHRQLDALPFEVTPPRPRPLHVGAPSPERRGPHTGTPRYDAPSRWAPGPVQPCAPAAAFQ